MVWEKVEIGNFTKSIKKWNPSSDFPNELFRYVDLSSVDKENKLIIDDEVDSLLGVEAPSRAKQVIKKNDILVSTVRPNLNGVAMIQKEYQKATASTGYCVLRTNEKKLDNKFLFYWVRSNMFIRDMIKKATGANYPAVSNKIIKKSKIPLPPLPIQKKIAAILDAADDYRQKTKALIEKYDQLTQSIFLDMFGDPVRNEKGWEKCKFTEFAEFDTKMVSNFDDYQDYPHIGIGNIEKNTGRLFGYNSIKEDKVISGKYLFTNKHIIYSKIRPNLNKVALPDFDGLCSADAYPLKPVKGITNRIFLSFILRSNSFLDFILSHSTRTNIPKANKSQMSKYNGICPPIELQFSFETKIRAIEKQKSTLNKSINKSEKLFQSLLQKAFKGELVK